MRPELGVRDLRKHGVGQVLGQHLQAVVFRPTQRQERFRLGLTRFHHHARVTESARFFHHTPVMGAFIQDARRPLGDGGHVRPAFQQFRAERFFHVAKRVQDVGPVPADSLEQGYDVPGVCHRPIEVHAQHRDPAWHRNADHVHHTLIIPLEIGAAQLDFQTTQPVFAYPFVQGRGNPIPRLLGSFRAVGQRVQSADGMPSGNPVCAVREKVARVPSFEAGLPKVGGQIVGHVAGGVAVEDRPAGGVAIGIVKRDIEGRTARQCREIGHLAVGMPPRVERNQ